MQSIPPTTANKQTQAQTRRGSRARKLLGAKAKSYRLKSTGNSSINHQFTPMLLSRKYELVPTCLVPYCPSTSFLPCPLLTLHSCLAHTCLPPVPSPYLPTSHVYRGPHVHPPSHPPHTQTFTGFHGAQHGLARMSACSTGLEICLNSKINFEVNL